MDVVAEGFEYETAIKDSMSGPAHHEAAALGELEKAVEKADASLHKLGEAHEHAGKSHEKGEGLVKSFTSSLIPEIAAGELAAEGIKKLGGALLELGEKVIDFGVEGVEYALESAEFKENMIQAFEVVSQSAEEGEKTYEAIEKMASAHHLDIGKTLAAAKELALSGVENEQIVSDSVQAIGALQRVGLDSGAEKLRRLIEQSEAAGHLILPKKLAGAGFTQEELAEKLGLPKGSDLKKLKIDTDKGIAAIDALINEGNVGKLAAKKFDLTDVATDWRNVWKQLTEDVDAGPLTSALKNFVSIFDEGSASGKVMKDEITSDINAIIAFLGPVVDDVEILVLRMVLGFQNGQHAAKPLVDDIKAMGLEGPDIASLGHDVEIFVAGLVHAAAEIAWVIAEWQHLGGEHEKAAKEAKNGAPWAAAAQSWIDGILGVLTGGGYVALESATSHLAQGAVDAFRNVWKTHSPSEVSADIASDIVAGYVVEMRGSTTKTGEAVAQAFAPTQTGSAPALGGGSRSYTIAPGAVVIHVESHASASELQSIVENALTDVLERTSLELGG